MRVGESKVGIDIMRITVLLLRREDGAEGSQ